MIPYKNIKDNKNSSYLLSKGMKLNGTGGWLTHVPQSIDPKNPEDLALQDGVISLIKSEPKNSIAITLIDNFGKTPLDYAIQYKNESIANALRERMTDEDVTVNGNYTSIEDY
jgi:uncharacterized lipoprotein YbaY